jgi:hypothetical protein
MCDPNSVHRHLLTDPPLQPEHGTEGRTGRRATSFERQSPHVGHTCFGDYCDYLTLYYAELPPSQRVKGTNCRFNLAFKSILMARYAYNTERLYRTCNSYVFIIFSRAEASFLEQDLDKVTSDYMQTLAELRKQSSDVSICLHAVFFFSCNPCVLMCLDTFRRTNIWLHLHANICTKWARNAKSRRAISCMPRTACLRHPNMPRGTDCMRTIVASCMQTH